MKKYIYTVGATISDFTYIQAVQKKLLSEDESFKELIYLAHNKLLDILQDIENINTVSMKAQLTDIIKTMERILEANTDKSKITLG